jgi:hypothetical protein
LTINLEEKELDIMEKEFFVVTRKRKFILHFNLRIAPTHEKI